MWTQTDRDKAIWHLRRKRETCQPCGTHPDDWDPAKGGDMHAWVAGEHHCRGCQKLQTAQEQADAKAEKGQKPMKGTTIVLERPKPKQTEEA